METAQQRPVVANPMITEDLTPTPTQAENDAAMIAATGGENAPAPPPDARQTGHAAAEHKPASPAPAAHQPERREHH